MIIASFNGSPDVYYGLAFRNPSPLYGVGFGIPRFEVSLAAGSGVLQIGVGSHVYPTDAVVVTSPNATTHGPVPEGTFELDAFSTEADPIAGSPFLSYNLQAAGPPFVYCPEQELSGYGPLRWIVTTSDGIPAPTFNIYVDI